MNKSYYALGEVLFTINSRTDQVIVHELDENYTSFGHAQKLDAWKWTSDPDCREISPMVFWGTVERSHIEGPYTAKCIAQGYYKKVTLSENKKFITKLERRASKKNVQIQRPKVRQPKQAA